MHQRDSLEARSISNQYGGDIFCSRSPVGFAALSVEDPGSRGTFVSSVRLVGCTPQNNTMQESEVIIPRQRGAVGGVFDAMYAF